MLPTDRGRRARWRRARTNRMISTLSEERSGVAYAERSRSAEQSLRSVPSASSSLIEKFASFCSIEPLRHA